MRIRLRVLAQDDKQNYCAARLKPRPFKNCWQVESVDPTLSAKDADKGGAPS